MYAICRIQGHQLRVKPDEILQVPRLLKAEGESVELGDILMVSDDKGVRFGTPHLEGRVIGRIVSHGRDEKVIVYKKLRRADYRRKRGHRQHFTTVKIESIEV
jgi:large subunit ribosomal protein L21